MLRARGLEKRYGRKRVLAGVDVDLASGGFLLVTGPNGSGKTTLLRLCAGLALPTRGELEVAVDRAERRERIGMLLERFGLWEARNERVASYSRGMTQRLALCRVLLHEPTLLVLDEPYTALDAEGAALLDRELAERRGAHAFLVSTHDPDRLAPLATGRLALA